MTFILQRLVPNEQVVLMNNAFSTFFVAGLYMLFWDWLREGIRTRSPRKILQAVGEGLVSVLCALPIYLVALLSFREDVSPALIRLLAAAALLVPNILTVEGGVFMVALGVLFYMFRTHRAAQIAALLLLSGVVYLSGDKVQSLMGLAAIPMLLYNGERGRGNAQFLLPVLSGAHRRFIPSVRPGAVNRAGKVFCASFEADAPPPGMYAGYGRVASGPQFSIRPGGKYHDRLLLRRDSAGHLPH